jgi:hypothetical protein
MHGTHEVEGKAMFVDSMAGNFHLQSTSAAINEGNPATAFNDSDGRRNTIGAFQYNLPTGLSPDPVCSSLIIVQAYPNPVSDEPFDILINGFDNLTTIHVTIYNVSGEMVYGQNVKGNNILSMPGSQFEKGIYIIKASNGLNSGTGKFIVK